MLYFIFMYNILLIVLYTIASTAFFISYMRRREPVDGWVALLFALFIIDNSMIYMTEIIADASGFFPQTIKALILCLFLLCYGQAFKYLYHLQFTRTDYICYAVYVAAILGTPEAPENRFVAWLHLAYVWIMLCYVLLRAYQAAKESESICIVQHHLRIKLLYIAGIAFVAAAMLENWIKVFSKQDLLFIDKNTYTRNISEDLYSVYLVVLALWYLLAKTFKSVLNTDIPVTAIGDVTEHENDLAGFARKYKITPRETEVLKLLIIGRTNQQISEALYISIGTVKNHVHSIYQKCEVAKRSQLLTLINTLP